MSVKKMLLLGAASVAAVGMTAVQAGGPTMEPTVPVADNGYYIEGNLGYAVQNYHDDRGWVGARNNNNSNVYGGFTGGVDAGYKINRNFGLELGWYDLPSVNVVNQYSQPTDWLSSWALYLAGKYMMPLPWMNNTDWFFKLGVEYRSATLSDSTFNDGVTTHSLSSNQAQFVRPMFGTGLDYSFSDAWSGIIQYTYFMGAQNAFSATNSTETFNVVAANVFTLGLGYKFTV